MIATLYVVSCRQVKGFLRKLFGDQGIYKLKKKERKGKRKKEKKRKKKREKPTFIYVLTDLSPRKNCVYILFLFTDKVFRSYLCFSVSARLLSGFIFTTE